MILRVLCALGGSILLASVAGARQDAERLTPDEARAYMVELINRDRAAKDLPPVRLDPTATGAAQSHAEEMAVYRYMAHRDRAGRLPDQRYTEAGGTGAVQENVYLHAGYRGREGPATLPLDDRATFVRREIEEMEAAYFNEVPPYDGHRRNILDPRHTHVGIGLARAGDDWAATLSNTQEFVRRWVEVEPLPREAPVGARLEIAGRVLPGARLAGVTLARGPLPATMTPEDLRKTRGYDLPPAFRTHRPVPDGAVRTGTDGRFRVEVALSDADRPGVYYVTVLLRDREGRGFAGSRRTIVVR